MIGAHCSFPLLRMLCAGAVGVLLLTKVPYVAGQGAPVDQYSQLLKANNLVSDGMLPFHLKMTFQLYDIEGKPNETGTVEQWWSGPHTTRTVIIAPSLPQNGSAKEELSDAGMRDSFLVQRLIDMVIQPLPILKGPLPKMDEVSRNFGKVRLKCLIPAPSRTLEAVSLPSLCTEKDSDRVHVLEWAQANEFVIRNTIGTFRGAFVSFEPHLSFVGLQAIAGKVTTLDGYNLPSSQPAADSQVDQGNPESSKAVSLSSSVIAGQRTSFVAPTYPSMAKTRHLDGSVLINAIIGKDGKIRRLVSIASSDQIFTESAIDAVRQWTYKPYLLNGQPTEVNTTITVNFALR